MLEHAHKHADPEEIRSAVSIILADPGKDAEDLIAEAEKSRLGNYSPFGTPGTYSSTQAF